MTNSTNTYDLGSPANGLADEAKSGASRVAGEVKKSGSVIGNEMKDFITDIEELVTTKAHGTFDVAKIKSDVSKRIAEYKASAEAAGNKMMTKAKLKAEGVNSYVHAEPWKAIGAGVAVGMLLGVVISRR